MPKSDRMGERITLDTIAGGSKKSGFIRAYMAKTSVNPDVQADWEMNETTYDKFKKIDRDGFDLKKMDRASRRLIRDYQNAWIDNDTRRPGEDLLRFLPAKRSPDGLYDVKDLYNKLMLSKVKRFRGKNVLKLGGGKKAKAKAKPKAAPEPETAAAPELRDATEAELAEQKELEREILGKVTERKEDFAKAGLEERDSLNWNSEYCGRLSAAQCTGNDPRINWEDKERGFPMSATDLNKTFIPRSVTAPTGITKVKTPEETVRLFQKAVRAEKKKDGASFGDVLVYVSPNTFRRVSPSAPLQERKFFVEGLSRLPNAPKVAEYPHSMYVEKTDEGKYKIYDADLVSDKLEGKPFSTGPFITLDTFPPPYFIPSQYLRLEYVAERDLVDLAMFLNSNRGNYLQYPIYHSKEDEKSYETALGDKTEYIGETAAMRAALEAIVPNKVLEPVPVEAVKAEPTGSDASSSSSSSKKRKALSLVEDMSEEDLLSRPVVFSSEGARRAIEKAAIDAASSDRQTAEDGMRELSHYKSLGFDVPVFLPMVGAPAAAAAAAAAPAAGTAANPYLLHARRKGAVDQVRAALPGPPDEDITGMGRKIPTHKLKMDYRGQSNDPRDIDRAIWNESQVEQQLRGGSWSQPPWNGWHPIIGAGYHPWQSHPMGYMGSGHDPDYFQRYAQDGDSGFFHSGSTPYRELAWCPIDLSGGAIPRGNPIGISPFPPNHINEDHMEVEEFEEPLVSTVVPEQVPKDTDPVITQNAEPQQRATYVPPYSQALMMGGKIEEGNVHYQDPLEIPKYKGGLHKKDKLMKR